MHGPFYDWRRRYREMMPSEMKKLRQFEKDAGKLKRLVDVETTSRFFVGNPTSDR